MAVALRSVGQSPGADSTSVVITKPANLAVGDLMIAHIFGAVVPGTIGTFTAPVTDPIWNPIRQDNNPGNDSASALFWKIAVQTDVDATDFTFVATSAVSSRGTITAWYGHNAAAPINQNNGQGNAASTTWGCPGITPSVANCMILLVAGIEDNVTMNSWGITTSDPGGWLEAYDLTSNLADDLALAMAYAIRPQTTATGVGVGTVGGSDVHTGQMLAIAPGTTASSETANAAVGAVVKAIARALALLRQAGVAVGLATTVSKVYGTSKLNSVSIGLATALAKVSAFQRSQTPALGLATAIDRVSTFAQELSPSLGLATEVAYTRGNLGSASAQVSLATVASRLLTLGQLAEAQMGLQPSVERLVELAQEISTAIAPASSVERATTFERSVPLTLGLASSAEGEQGGAEAYEEEAVTSLGLASEISREATTSRSVLATVGLASALNRGFERTLATSLALVSATTRASVFERLLDASLSLASATARIQGLVRVLTVGLGLSGALARGYQVTRTLMSALVLQGLITRILEGQREVVTAIGEASEVALAIITAYDETFSAQIGLASTATREFAIKRLEVASSGLAAVCERASNVLRVLSTAIGIGREWTGAPESFERTSVSSLSLTSSVETTRTPAVPPITFVPVSGGGGAGSKARGRYLPVRLQRKIAVPLYVETIVAPRVLVPLRLEVSTKTSKFIPGYVTATKRVETLLKGNIELTVQKSRRYPVLLETLKQAEAVEFLTLLDTIEFVPFMLTPIEVEPLVGLKLER